MFGTESRAIERFPFAGNVLSRQHSPFSCRACSTASENPFDGFHRTFFSSFCHEIFFILWIRFELLLSICRAGKNELLEPFLFVSKRVEHLKACNDWKFIHSRGTQRQRYLAIIMIVSLAIFSSFFCRRADGCNCRFICFTFRFRAKKKTFSRSLFRVGWVECRKTLPIGSASSLPSDSLVPQLEAILFFSSNYSSLE